MIRELLLGVGIIFAALAGWLRVQAAARRFAARHPELGPAREECAGGCAGHGCAEKGTACTRELDS
jgi:hypothetical protein